ncbi:MAG: DUF2280 domain-containing protein [Sphingobium sp.]
MATLSESEKHFVIEKLAQFCGHAEVARQLELECGVVVDRWQIRTYDPTHPKFAGGEKLRELFWAKRAAYESVIEDVPIAHQAYRLNMLQRMLDEARARGNISFALKILKQARGEVAKTGIDRADAYEAGRRSVFREMSSNMRQMLVAEILREDLLAKKGIENQHLTVVAEAA